MWESKYFLYLHGIQNLGQLLVLEEVVQSACGAVSQCSRLCGCSCRLLHASSGCGYLTAFLSLTKDVATPKSLKKESEEYINV